MTEPSDNTITYVKQWAEAWGEDPDAYEIVDDDLSDWTFAIVATEENDDGSVFLNYVSGIDNDLKATWSDIDHRAFFSSVAEAREFITDHGLNVARAMIECCRVDD